MIMSKLIFSLTMIATLIVGGSSFLYADVYKLDLKDIDISFTKMIHSKFNENISGALYDDTTKVISLLSGKDSIPFATASKTTYSFPGKRPFDVGQTGYFIGTYQKPKSSVTFTIFVLSDSPIEKV